MDANYEKIKDSLRAAGREALRVHLGEGIALLGAVSLLLLLVGLVFAVQFSLIPYIRTGYLILCTFIIIYVSYRHILTPILPLWSEDRLALIIEKRLPELKDSLISSLQLGRDLENPKRTYLYSHELISSLFKQTAQGLQGLRPQDVAERRDLRRNVKALGVVVGVFAIFAVSNPGFIAQRFHLLLKPQYAPSGLIQLGAPVIGDITLTYRYPAYTGLKPRTISGSSGRIRALKGSEVEILAQSSQAIASASILINESTRVTMAVETPYTLKGSLIVLEGGSYSFETLAIGGKSLQKSKPLRIIVEDDDYPKINILSPTSEKVVSERDVVRLAYEATDDFGLKEIRLAVGEGPGAERVKKDLKVIKEAEREYRGSFNWDLSELGLVPGEKVPYYLEAVDNDAVSGPKVARSRTQYLEIYSTQKRHDELLSLQDKLLREMIQLLAEKLLNPPNATESRDELLLQQEVLIDRTINLLVLFDRVLTGMEEDALANYAVYYSLENMRNRISQFNDNKEKNLEKAEKRGPVLPVSIISEIQAMQDNEIVELENDIIFLVELLRKQRLDDFLRQDRRIEGMEKVLTNLLNDLAQGRTSELDDQVRKEIQKLEDMIRSMMEKLSKLSSNWGDEFLNLEALKALGELTLNKDIQEMKDALARGDFEAALKAALSAASALEKMLAEMEQSAQQYVDSAYSRILQEMNSLDKMLRELEEDEHQLAQQTEKLKKDIQSRTFEEMDQALSGFFDRQLSRLDGMKGYLSQLEKSLSENSNLNEYSRTEREVDRLLRKRNQAMRSPYLFGTPGASGFSNEEFAELNKKLRELNEARNQEPLLDTYGEMSKALPKLKEKLSQLSEMLKGQDIKESLNLSSDTLKDLRYWNYEVKEGSSIKFPHREEGPSSKKSQKMKKNTGEMLAGARGLNEEMVEELESIRESFDKMSKGKLTEEEVKNFEQLAKRQDELESHTRALAQSMEELAEGTPPMGSEAHEKLGEAQEFMGQAEGKLQDKDSPGALTDEREALYKLSQARKSLGEAMDRMAKGMMSRGIPMPKYVLRYRDTWSEGGRGFTVGEVEIPPEEAYKVPKEFRQDILDAMKQGLPKKYQELNKDYYRKLVE
ncbi:MAG: DUF4175 family protein [Candidatus Brocadiales bacterium]